MEDERTCGMTVSGSYAEDLVSRIGARVRRRYPDASVTQGYFGGWRHTYGRDGNTRVGQHLDFIVKVQATARTSAHPDLARPFARAVVTVGVDQDGAVTVGVDCPMDSVDVDYVVHPRESRRNVSAARSFAARFWTFVRNVAGGDTLPPLTTAVWAAMDRDRRMFLERDGFDRMLRDYVGRVRDGAVERVVDPTGTDGLVLFRRTYYFDGERVGAGIDRLRDFIRRNPHRVFDTFNGVNYPLMYGALVDGAGRGQQGA